MSTSEYDIIVVGAGLAGSAFAATMAALTDQRIAVIERAIPTAITQPDPHSRPISLSHASTQILDTLGWWTDMAPHAACIERVEVSQENRLGVVNFLAQEQNILALGHAVPCDFLHQTLYQATAAHPQIDFILADRLCSIEQDHERPHLIIEKNGEKRELSASLLVAADGAQSDCRSLLGIETQSHADGSIAISGELKLATDHQNTAYQRFSDAGIVAILPLPDPHTVRFVLTQTRRQQEHCAHWGDAAWLAWWQQVLRGRLVVLEHSLGQRFPLSTQMADVSVAPCVVLLGNAAHTIYPLAAQGFNLTLRDIAALCELLVQAIGDSPQNWASTPVLQQYAQWRDGDARALQHLTQGLDKAFSLHLPGLDHMRGIGMLALDMLPGSKAALGRFLLGLGGRVPKLARGVLPQILTAQTEPEATHA